MIMEEYLRDDFFIRTTQRFIGTVKTLQEDVNTAHIMFEIPILQVVSFLRN